MLTPFGRYWRKSPLGVYKNEMENIYIGALGGTNGVLCMFGSVKVPDGLWAIFGAIDLDNNTDAHQLLEVRLDAKVAWDSRFVRLGPNGKTDHASVSLMVLAAFPGNNTSRVNQIGIGTWNHYDSPYQVPAVKAGRLKIIAMRLNSFIGEQSPGTDLL